MKIVSIVGARPNFIKLAPLSREIRKSFSEIIIHTGQHYDYNMSQDFFNSLNIPKADYFLNINRTNASEQVSKMLAKIDPILIQEHPDLVVVYGDTNSTLAGAIASIQNHIPVAHIEAGPRNKKIDIIENLNRILVDRCSSLLFCSTDYNLKILKKEGLDRNAFFVGDLMYDMLLKSINEIKDKFNVLLKYGLSPQNYCVVTCHRAETTDIKGRLSIVLNALIDSEKKCIFSIHPRTKKMLRKFNLYEKMISCDNIIPIESIGYFEFLQLAYHSEKIITDSGGVQREAYFLKKPCVIIFDESGWPEINETGWQVITGINEKRIIHAIQYFTAPETHPPLFGNGTAAIQICECIKSFDFKDWNLI